MPPVEKTKYVTNNQINDFKNKINKWQASNYIKEGFKLKGLKFLSDIAIFLIYTKFKYDLEFNQIFRWNIRNYKLDKIF